MGYNQSALHSREEAHNHSPRKNPVLHMGLLPIPVAPSLKEATCRQQRHGLAAASIGQWKPPADTSAMGWLTTTVN